MGSSDWVDADGNQLMYTDHELELIREQKRIGMKLVDAAWRRRKKKDFLWDIGVSSTVFVLFVVALLLIVLGHG